jgi:hypothetical protein
MKYLKLFESFTSDKLEEQIEDLFIGITDELGAGIQVVMDRFTNAGPRMERLQVKILLPHGYEHSPMDVYYKIRNELVPIHNKIMKDYGLKFSGCSQLKRIDDPNYYGVVNLIYYKYEDQKQFESFGQFQLDEISKQEYYSILDNNRLVYIPESKVLEFKSKLSKEYKLLYARGDKKDTVEYFRAEYETEINYHFTCKSFSIKKKSQGVDEPCYIMFYNYEEFTSHQAPKSHIETLPDQKRISFQKKSYYRFEESDFDQMCENPQILLDYLEKDIIKESFEYEGERFIEKICKGWGVEIEDLEDLFIDFSDDGGKVLFSYMEVKDGVIQITIKDIWKDLNDRDWLYNPLWDKRFNSIKIKLNRFGLDMNVIPVGWNFGRYADVRIFPITDKKGTHSKTDIVTESFGDIPDPEPMDVNEWDDEVTNAQEIAFTQKEKELFISLSDTISVKNKRSMPDIGKFYLYFILINGDLNPKLRETTPISNISIYKNDDEFYFVALWTGDGLFAERELWAGGEKLYRCDGYECLEKFLKEIFKGYRELVNKQSKTNESYFDEIPEPELMDLNEWDEEVTNAREVDFTQQEKELFISLSDTILVKHKIDALEIGDSHLSFSMVNGEDRIYPNLRSTTVIRSITSYKNDDEFYYVSVWEGDDIDGGTKSHHQYRCDG